ncbi:APH(3'') family aminoglycoside O-phosphotransferase [Streptomyces sp. HNM0574]|uniref:APH(3'') family aminoglycoside O-phosphotransferase n=1 Tax=Streptomyces sp. HNM0574 TaxID=2714954 RepID=UPI00146DAEE4|nr:APH(3'') family aminoglycoside O-phosphotransferase [Streptomyces sp. HNM0574]NLU68224.1 APH(3'') family aminoglycoside O-phosphotransferase [Streptomyces sp. HNM0574]
MSDHSVPHVVSPELFGLPGGDWLPVTAGESGAYVYRGTDGSRYAKCVPPAAVSQLSAERDRIAWLNGQGLPGARVLDWRSGDRGACLLTSTVPGVPADQLPAEELWSAWRHIADAVRRLHELSILDCPFSRGLDSMAALAHDVVARDAVHPEFLPPEQRHTPPAELLARLTGRLDRVRQQEPADTVVCHGDLCLPNIILDPTTLHVTGFIDLGRLGLADRHADLALLLTNARETWPDESRARAADSALTEHYGTPLDPDRLRFYLDLDPLTWG